MVIKFTSYYDLLHENMILILNWPRSCVIKSTINTSSCAPVQLFTQREKLRTGLLD
jgi:hypothetical protein